MTSKKVYFLSKEMLVNNTSIEKKLRGGKQILAGLFQVSNI